MWVHVKDNSYQVPNKVSNSVGGDCAAGCVGDALFVLFVLFALFALSALFVFLAFLTKQTALVVALPIALWLLLADWRRGVVWGGGLAERLFVRGDLQRIFAYRRDALREVFALPDSA